MKRLIHASIIAVLVSLAMIASISGRDAESQAHSKASLPEPGSFEEVLMAHGGPKAIASVGAFKAEAVRLTSTSPTDFFERQMVISVEGESFLRCTADPLGLRRQVESFDDGAFYAASFSRDARGETIYESLPANAERLQAVRFSIASSGLLPILQRFADASDEVILQDRIPGRFDRYTVKTSTGIITIFADQSHLIRRIEMEDKVYQFADYRPAGALRLPFVQRLSVGDRIVYEWFFSKIDLNPTFPPEYFKRPDLAG